jgi:hypothetical protein
LEYHRNDYEDGPHKIPVPRHEATFSAETTHWTFPITTDILVAYERRLDELSTLEAGLGTAQAEAELDVLSALSNETRYTLVRVLVAAGEELCVCELNAVVDVMDEAGFDLSDRTLREISIAELQSCDYVATMGCSTLDNGEVGEDVDIRDWALGDPDGQDIDRVRVIRDEIEQRVVSLFDEFNDAH